MASKLVQITAVDKAWELWEAGLLVNVDGQLWAPIGEVRELWHDDERTVRQRFPRWLEPKTGGGGYVYVETDED